MRTTWMAMAACLALATPAAAAPTSVWVQCDGMVRPEPVAVTAAKIGATVLSAGLYIFALEESGVRRHGQVAIDACTQALADPVLDEHWWRKVSLIRTRALNYAEMGEFDLALADLRLTHAAAEGHLSEAAFARSQGVSIQLFEAALLARKGQTADADKLAVAAADARPYSSKVQTLAAILLSIDPGYSVEEDRVLTRRAKLDPGALAIRASAREWGDPVGAADDWVARAAAVRRLPPDGAYIPRSFQYTQGSAVLLPYLLARAAIATAAVGRTQEARALLTELGSLTPWEPASPTANKREAARYAEVSADSAASIREAQRYAPLAEAIIKEREGRPDEARTLLGGGSVPAIPATFDLMAKLSASDRKAFAGMRDKIRAERSAAVDPLEFARALPALERPPKKSPFISQGPYGFRGGPGFLDRDNKAGGWTIEYAGAGASPLSEEMVLLRAAQIARERGARTFTVIRKPAYGGQAQMSVDVVFDSPVGPPPALALDAEAIWTDLGSVYLQPTVAVQ